MKRLPFLDWARGFAVLIMILCHAFNSFTQVPLRTSGAYMLSQSIGGMASVLFLFMAGMTFAFQMASADRRHQNILPRWRSAAMRGAYVLALAYAFRLTTWAFDYPGSPARTILKVDILNCMGLSMLLLSAVAMVDPARRVWAALGAGCTIIALAPLVALPDWSAMPTVVYHYVVQQRGVFALFPYAAYLSLGLATGLLLTRPAKPNLDHLMMGTAALGTALIMAGKYASQLPFTLYPKMDYWLHSPALMSIRTGIVLLVIAAAYLWTEYATGGGWSWMQAMGKTSLLVYFVHIMIVYGWVSQPWRRALTVEQSAIATLLLTAAMVALAQARLMQLQRAALRRAPA
ncbi:MAG: DUF1624 domain-containing protein [Acidobacteriia bacterium]|nr:DUF1624 domain-containing protein [Terriglobia bacterium]